MAEEHSLPYYLLIAGGRIIGFIPFPRVLVLCDMQSVSSRIWIRVAVSISYDDNHYTTGTSKKLFVICVLIVFNKFWPKVFVRRKVFVNKSFFSESFKIVLKRIGMLQKKQRKEIGYATYPFVYIYICVYILAAFLHWYKFRWI